MMNDYTNKVIGNLENIESALREEINDYGQSAGFWLCVNIHNVA